MGIVSRLAPGQRRPAADRIGRRPMPAYYDRYDAWRINRLISLQQEFPAYPISILDQFAVDDDGWELKTLNRILMTVT